MEIAIISDCRKPTLADGGHGLGMSAHEIATGLLEMGHAVTLLAGPGSQFGGKLAIYDSEVQLASTGDIRPYDAILDTSHDHWLTKLQPHAPVVNRIADLECRWRPPNMVVNSPYMQNIYSGARLVNTGIRPFEPIEPGKRLARTAVFLSSHEHGQGLDIAHRVCQQVGFDLVTQRRLLGAEKWELLAMAAVLLCPSTHRAAPRLPLEAAMMDTPTLCLNGDGAQYHVADGVSGYVCAGENEMAEKLNCLHFIKPDACREWANEHHSYGAMLDAYAGLLTAVAQGGRW